jgi:hypothetical protein
MGLLSAERFFETMEKIKTKPHKIEKPNETLTN